MTTGSIETTASRATELLPLGHSRLRIGSDQIRLATTDPPDAEGPPLIVLNGVGPSADVFGPVMRRLRRVRTVALDLPGAVRSASSPLPRRLSGYARLLREVLDGLHFERVHVMGISWGGALAQEFTHQHAERVSRVVLAATSAEPTVVPLRLRTGTLYGGDFDTDATLAQRGAHDLAPTSPIGYLCMRFAQAGWSSAPWLRTLRRPTLVLAGEHDPIVPLAAAKALADGLPNAYFESFDCGHLFVLTRAQRVVAALERFLLESIPLIKEPRHG